MGFGDGAASGAFSGASIGTTIAGTIGEIQDDKIATRFSQNENEFQARMREMNAGDILRNAEERVANIRNQKAQSKGSKIAKSGKSGVEAFSGSAGEVLTSEEIMFEQDVYRTRRNARSEARGQTDEAETLRAESKFAEVARKSRKMRTITKGGASVLTSAADAFGNAPKKNTTKEDHTNIYGKNGSAGAGNKASRKKFSYYS